MFVPDHAFCPRASLSAQPRFARIVACHILPDRFAFLFRNTAGLVST
jgi:hypothetical protein